MKFYYLFKTKFLFLMLKIIKNKNLNFKWGHNIVLKEFHITVNGEFSKLIFYNNISSRSNLKIIVENGDLTINNNVFFNNDCSINCLDKITIGENCLFGENVKIYDHNHIFKHIEVPIRDQGFSCAEIVIGSNTWIGSNVTILKGTKIGKNCIIGANSLITGVIPDNMIVKHDNKLIYTQRI